MYCSVNILDFFNRILAQTLRQTKYKKASMTVNNQRGIGFMIRSWLLNKCKSLYQKGGLWFFICQLMTIIQIPLLKYPTNRCLSKDLDEIKTVEYWVFRHQVTRKPIFIATVYVWVYRHWKTNDSYIRISSIMFQAPHKIT